MERIHSIIGQRSGWSWSFAQRYPEAKPSEFIEMLRRAEVLLALIGARHALKTPDDFPDQHDGALVGIDTLQSVVSQGANKLIRLSYYATLEDVKQVVRSSGSVGANCMRHPRLANKRRKRFRISGIISPRT